MDSPLRYNVPVPRRFVTTAPSAQTAVDAFGKWASRLPLEVEAGEADTFRDPRVEWGIKELGGVEGKRVLELGPLEGGHSYTLQQHGASVVAVEANRDSYLKCLVVKELLGLDRCHFLCGNVVEYLRETEERFDMILAAGILYHMTDPVELLSLITRRTERLYLWTHYYSGNNGRMSRGLSDTPTEYEQAGYRHVLHRNRYGITTRLRGFWGGIEPYSNWMTRDGLLGALKHLGWTVRVGSDEQTPSGAAIALVAMRSRPEPA